MRKRLGVECSALSVTVFFPRGFENSSIWGRFLETSARLVGFFTTILIQCGHKFCIFFLRGFLGSMSVKFLQRRFLSVSNLRKKTVGHDSALHYIQSLC